MAASMSYTSAVIPKSGAPVELWDSIVQPLGPRNVRLRVIYAGVCGTDRHLWLGEMAFPFAYVLGHEGLGRIEAMGGEVTSDFAGSPVAVGDMVYWNPIAPCHACYHCTVTRDFTSCSNSSFLSPADLPTFASYTQIATLKPDNSFYKVASHVPPKAMIALGCALPTMLQAMDNLGDIHFDSTVVIQGAGPLGLASVMLAQLAGAQEIIVLEAHELRLQMAKDFGATHTLSLRTHRTAEARKAKILELIAPAVGVDPVIEASGQVEAFAEGLALLRRNGRYLVVGTWAGSGTAPVSPFDIVFKALRIIGTTYAAPQHYHRAVKIVEKYHDRFPLERCVTHVLPLRQTEKAFELITHGEAVKVAIDPQKD